MPRYDDADTLIAQALIAHRDAGLTLDETAQALIGWVVQCHARAGRSPEETAQRLVARAMDLVAGKVGVPEALAYLRDQVLPAVAPMVAETRAGRPQVEKDPDPIFLQAPPRGRQ